MVKKMSTRLDVNPNSFPEQVFMEYPKCVRRKKENGEYEYRDCLTPSEEQIAITNEWETIGKNDEKAFDKAANGQQLPDDYVSEEYPKYIAALGRDVHSKEEEQALLVQLPEFAKSEDQELQKEPYSVSGLSSSQKKK